MREPPPSRIAELEKAIYSCIKRCCGCGSYATWDARSRFMHAFRPWYCDACKTKLEGERQEDGRHKGELTYDDWKPLPHNIELIRVISAGGRAADKVQVDPRVAEVVSAAIALREGLAGRMRPAPGTQDRLWDALDALPALEARLDYPKNSAERPVKVGDRVAWDIGTVLEIFDNGRVLVVCSEQVARWRERAERAEAKCAAMLETMRQRSERTERLNARVAELEAALIKIRAAAHLETERYDSVWTLADQAMRRPADSVSTEQTCRRCSECQGENHHWLEHCDDPAEVAEPFVGYVCKHCDARAEMCDACSGAVEPGHVCDFGEEGPFVCPGCHAVGGEKCAPGCIDDEIARDAENAYERGENDDDDE